MNTTVTREPELASRLRRAQAETLRTPTAAPARRRARASVRRRATPGAMLGKTVAWLALVGLSYAGSTLLGQTMLEQARREGLRAQARAREANMDAAMLRDRLRRLTSMRAVDEWATVRGFTPQEKALVVLGGPMRVARR